MARTSGMRQRIKGFGLFVAGGLLLSASSFGQGYTNPRYQSTPRKGDAVQVPSYSSPGSAGSTPNAPSNAGHAPSYNPSSTGEYAEAAPQHGLQLGVNVEYPTGLGDAGGSLKPRFGGNVQVYLPPLLDEQFRNFASIGFDQFALKSDGDTKLNLVPFSVGLEFQTDAHRTFNPNMGIAIGGAYAWIGVPAGGSQNMNGRAYFLAQFRPAIDINLDGFSIVVGTPVTYLIGSSKMSYIAYSLGARFGL